MRPYSTLVAVKWDSSCQYKHFLTRSLYLYHHITDNVLQKNPCAKPKPLGKQNRCSRILTIHVIIRATKIENCFIDLDARHPPVRSSSTFATKEEKHIVHSRTTFLTTRVWIKKILASNPSGSKTGDVLGSFLPRLFSQNTHHLQRRTISFLPSDSRSP